MLRKLKIGSRMYLGFTIILFLFVCMIYFTISQINSMSKSTYNLYAHPYLVTSAINKINSNITKTNIEINSMLTFKESQEIEAGKKIIDGYMSEILNNIDILSQQFLGDIENINNLKELIVEWQAYNNEIFSFILSGNIIEAHKIIHNQLFNDKKRISNLMQTISLFAENKSKEFLAEIVKTDSHTRNMLYLQFFIYSIAALIIAFLIIRSLTVPIYNLSKAVERFCEAEGRIDIARFDFDLDIDSNDEIERFAFQFKKMAVKISRLIKDLQIKSEITSNMGEGVVLINASDGSIIYCNLRFEQMFGYGPSELIGKNISIVNAPSEKSPEDTAKEIIESLNKNSVWQDEIQNIKKTGELFWCHATVSTFQHYDYGKVWISIHSDITQLKETTEEFLRFFNLSRDIMAIFSIDGHFTMVNPMFENVLGYTKEEISSKHIMDLIHPDDLERTIAEIDKQNKGSDTFDFINRYLCKDGSYKTLSWNGGATFGGKIYANARDVSEQKKLESALKENEEKYRTLFESMAQGVCYQSPEGQITTVNNAALDILGLTLDQCLGKTSFDPRWKALKEDGTPYKGEEHPAIMVLKTGKEIRDAIMIIFNTMKNNYVYVIVNAIPQYKKGEDKPFQVFTTFQDITKIKKMEEIMHQQLKFKSSIAFVTEALLNPNVSKYVIADIVHDESLKLTESVHGYISLINEDEDCVAVNVTEMLSKDCKIYDNKQITKFPKGANGYNALWGHSLNTIESFFTNNPKEHKSYKGCLPAGHIELKNFLSAPIILDNKIIGQISLANSVRDYSQMDLTIIDQLASILAVALDRKNIEEQLKNLNTNLNNMVTEETQKRQQQEQILIQQSKMASMGEMIGLIAHQWKQPLNAVGLIVQDLKEAYSFGELNDKYMANSVNIAIEQIMFMSKTIDDFRNFFIPSKEKIIFDVKLSIEQLYSMFENVFTKSNINVSVKVNKETVLSTKGYPNEFKQVLLNILNNAKDAIISRRNSEPKIRGLIDINLSNSEDLGKIIISIKDNGGGIPQDIIEKIFDSYYTTKESTGGTGIGLYMSKTIIEINMGGTLEVKNVDEGAEFLITLDIIDRDRVVS